jgi:hypothetical protein
MASRVCLISVSMFALVTFNISRLSCPDAKGQIMELVATLAEKEKEIRECQDNLQNIKSHGTDLQTFLGLKKIEAEITKNELFVQSLIDDHKMSQRMLHCKIHQSLKTLTRHLVVIYQ